MGVVLGRHSAGDDDDVDVELLRAAQLAAAGGADTGRHFLSEPVFEPLPAVDAISAQPDRAPGSTAVRAQPVADVAAASGAPARPSRAGRNLPAAIGVALVLAGAVLASLLVYRPSFVVVVCAAMSYGTFEMVRAMAQHGIKAPLLPLLAGGLAMDVEAWFQGADALVLGLMLTVAGVLIWRLDGGFEGYQRDTGAAAFIAVYVPLLGGFAVLSAHYSDGAGRVLAFILLVACSDIGGYAAGVLFGRHPMAPTVSPKKSWEGFGGSLVACAVAGSLLMSQLFHHAWSVGALFGAAIAVTATLGDLGESMIKRDLRVKDMGRLLPGHGGLMDRLDSLLPCAAVAYLVFGLTLST